MLMLQCSMFSHRYNDPIQSLYSTIRCTQHTDRLQMSVNVMIDRHLCACVCVEYSDQMGHRDELRKNGCTDREPVSDVVLCRPKETCIRWGPDLPPPKKGQLWLRHVGRHQTYNASGKVRVPEYVQPTSLLFCGSRRQNQPAGCWGFQSTRNEVNSCPNPTHSHVMLYPRS